MSNWGQNFEATYNYVATWGDRFFTSEHPLAWPYWVSFLIITILFYFISFRSNWKIELWNQLNSKKFRNELLFDLKSFSFKFIFDAAVFFFIGFNYNRWGEVIHKKLYTLVPFDFINQPLILDGFYGSILLSLAFYLAWDFGNFVGHYATHRIDSLWRFHAFHHTASVLNPLTKYRGHPLALIAEFTIQGLTVTIVMYLFRLIFLVPEGLTFASLKYIFAAHYLFIHLRHSFVRISFGPYLSYFFISPYMHQVHHSYLPQHKNKNFGVTFALWDYMFGSLYIPKPDEELQMGISDNYVRSKSVIKELLRPFSSQPR